MCHVSHVTCHMSHVIYLKKLKKLFFITISSPKKISRLALYRMCLNMLQIALNTNSHTLSTTRWQSKYDNQRGFFPVFTPCLNSEFTKYFKYDNGPNAFQGVSFS